MPTTLKSQTVYIACSGGYQPISRTVSKVKRYASGIVQGEVSINGDRYIVSKNGQDWSVIRRL